MCTFFTFLSDRLVYMILLGQIDPKHQCNIFFSKFCRLDTLQWVQRFLGGAKALISYISKSIALGIKIFLPMDSITPVSCLSTLHYAALTPLVFELFLKTMHFVMFVTF